MAITYDIRLGVRYLYDAPASSVRSLLRIMPRAMPGQDVLSGGVSAMPPPAHSAQAQDFFGNPICLMIHDQPVTELAFGYEGRVARNVGLPDLGFSDGPDALAASLDAVRDLGPDAPHHFLGPSERVGADRDIAAFARDVTGGAMSVADMVRALSTALHGELAFDPEATDVATPPGEAFRNRHGVCQDFSHIMIAALRSRGVPAGYVSGFLQTVPPPGQPRLEGADAMHAWVRAWCGPGVGWIEIDPTNDTLVANDHVVIAVGRDYADVAPVRGAAISAGSHSTEHQVDVVPV